ncbi:MAG TPA: peptide chain release factor 2 [Verrucomicrobiae bacterium]|nr:peptide chain release factor 2 [Verrucomicrobiae bacterium]
MWCFKAAVIEELKDKLRGLHERHEALGRYLDVPKQRARLVELENVMAGPTFWVDQNKARAIHDEANSIRRKLDTLVEVERKISDAQVLIELGEAEAEVAKEVQAAERQMDAFELQSLLGDQHDKSNAIFNIHAGAGGTESCDWADMLLRMYRRWCDARGFKNEIMDIQPGEGAGIKSVTMLVTGDYAYGYLKAERGVHRLVRISPFDSNKRRHTSFASVDVVAEIEDAEVELKMEDVRVDTFRSGGKGGQNVNKLETAIRMTHEPTGIVVQCQSERSQHQNRELALKVLKARLYEKQQDEKRAALEKYYGEKGAIAWGNQIRSYVFQPYQMVKDLRTGHQTSDIQGVMDGDLDPFISAWLKAGKPRTRKQGVTDEE